MPANLKRAFYVHFIPHAEFLRIMASRDDIELTRLERTMTIEEASETLAAAHAYQISAARNDLPPHFFATDALLRHAPNLLIVSSSGAGYDTIDVDACTRAGVLAVNQAGGNKEAVAEHALALMLSLSKRIVETDRVMRREAGIDRNAYMGRDIMGKTLGIIGLGHVGRRVAELCQGLFRMRVVAFDPYVSAETMTSLKVEKVALPDLMRVSDFVSIHCPLTNETRGMVGRDAFAAMRPHAYFLTTARGEIHDEDALHDALVNKRIAGAGLDVWEREPPPPEHPLLSLDNVIASPHMAGVTEDARFNMGKISAENLVAALDGVRPDRILNPEVWPRYQERFEAILGRRPQ